MAEKINRVIFIGFPASNKNELTPSTLKMIMDVFSVNDNQIYLFPEGTRPEDIVGKSFTIDKSKEFGYDIGNSICVVSNGVPSDYRLRIERLNNIGIAVRSGYDHIDFEEVNESEFTDWYKSGNFKKIGTVDDHETDDENSGIFKILSESEHKTLDEKMNEVTGGEDISKDIESIVDKEEAPFSGDEGSDDVEPTPGVEEEYQDDGDDDDIIASVIRERKRIAKMKKEEEDRKASSSKEAEKQLAPLKGVDEFSDKANSLEREAESAVEQIFSNDGKRRTYKDHLSSEARAIQEVMESSKKKFGNIADEKVVSEGGDMNYINRNKGRIVLVTSGKGGVGKSTVAEGMASSLSLARAKQRINNPSANASRTWLIESDYNSPQLALAYKTRSKHLGNVAEIVASGGKGVESSAVRKAIEDNAHIDPETGVHILACPPLSSKMSSKEIPYAIILAVKYASDNGDDVIIDHGNLTTGEYSELDHVLSMSMAHRVVVVCNMGCIPETQSTLSLLCDKESSSAVTPRPILSVSVVLNSALNDQYFVAQDELNPFEILNIIPPIDALRAENSMTGNTYLKEQSIEIKKAIIDRCGVIMTKIGYDGMKAYFPTGLSGYSVENKRSQSFVRRIVSKFFN